MTTPNHSILVLGAGTLGLPILRHLISTIASLPSSTTKPTLSVTLRPSNPVFSPLPNITPSPAHSASNPATPPNPLTATLQELITHHNLTPIPIDLSHSTLAELTTLFTHYHTVISATGFALTSTSPTFPLLIAQAAISAGVKRFLPWAFGLDYPALGVRSGKELFDAQLDVRALLSAQTKVDWTVMPVGIFSDFLGAREWGVVDVAGPRAGRGRGPDAGAPVNNDDDDDDDHGGAGEGTLRALGSWDTPITVTTPDDIARGVAKVLFDPDVSLQGSTTSQQARDKNTVYLSTSTTTYSALASAVEKVLRRKCKREVLTTSSIEESLQSDPDNGLLQYQLVFARGIGTSWPESVCLDLGPGADAEHGLDGLVRAWFR